MNHSRLLALPVALISLTIFAACGDDEVKQPTDTTEVMVDTTEAMMTESTEAMMTESTEVMTENTEAMMTETTG